MEGSPVKNVTQICKTALNICKMMNDKKNIANYTTILDESVDGHKRTLGERSITESLFGCTHPEPSDDECKITIAREWLCSYNMEKVAFALFYLGCDENMIFDSSSRLSVGHGYECHDDYAMNIKNGEKLLPSWFVPRMMDDVWHFGLLLTDSSLVLLSHINRVDVSANGDLWIHADLDDRYCFDNWRERVHYKKVIANDIDRCNVSINATYVIAAFELADT